MHTRSINGPEERQISLLASQKALYRIRRKNPAVDAQKWNAIKTEHLDQSPIHSIRHDSSS